MLAQVNKPVQVNKTREFHSKKTVTLQYAHYILQVVLHLSCKITLELKSVFSNVNTVTY